MRLKRKYRSGIALIIALIFLVIFSALSVGMLGLSTGNAQVARNHQQGNGALNAALSGLECARYVAQTTPTFSTNINYVTDAQANQIWTNLRTRLASVNLGSKTVSPDDGGTGTEISTPYPYISGQPIPCQSGGTFRIRFYRDTAAPTVIGIETIGNENGIERTLRMNLNITKDAKVMNYAVASRGRIWLTGDTTIHGPIYSAWNLSTSQLTQLTNLNSDSTEPKYLLAAMLAAGTLNSTSFASLVNTLSLTPTNRTTILNELTSGALSPDKAATRCIGFMSTSSLSVAPFNMTSDSTVLGTIGTCWSKEQVGPKSWQFETLDASGNPIYQTDGQGNVLYETDGSGNYLLDDKGDMIKARVVSSGDEIQGITAGINYGEAPQNLDGMNIADYDTTEYYNATLTANGGSGAIPSPSSTQYSGTDAGLASLGSTCGTKWRYERFPHNSDNYTTGTGIQVKRYIYKNQTFSNVRLPVDKNALFINCTFDNVLYVDAGKTTSNYNNVRFDNCNFNGTIVSNTPQTFNWQKNTLYFTGSATFQNDVSADATILAPHFNVNLGNTNPVAGTNNVLRGAIVGGIVDVRGNAEVFGTIISMADTSSYTSGYVSNIGATLDDGGSETVAIGDVGTINITPDPENMIPSGITTPIILKPQMQSYQECI